MLSLRLGSHLFEDGQVDAEHIGGVGVAGAIGLQGSAVVGILGGHEEGGQGVGLLPGGGMAVVGEMEAKVAQEFLAFDTATEGSTDESQGQETEVVGIVFLDEDAVVGGKLVELTGIGLLLAGGVQAAKLMTEQAQHLVLETGDGIVAHHIGTVAILEDDIAGFEVGEDDALDESEKVKTDLHGGSALANLHGEDLSLVARPGSGIDDNRVFGLELLDGLVDVEVEVTVLEEGLQLLHLLVAGDGLLALVVAIVVHTEPRLGVPAGMEKGLDALG